MSSSSYFTIALIAFILCGIFLATSLVLFISFRIPTVIKDMRGTLEKRQIEEIRIKNVDMSARKGSINVFEELQQRAKPRSNNTHRIKLTDTTGGSTGSKSAVAAEPQGTVVLQKSSYVISKEFRIEKNIIFVSTTDVLG